MIMNYSTQIKNNMAGTALKQCNCKGPAAEYQDKVYGKNLRLHNVSEDGKKFVCTVCGAKR